MKRCSCPVALVILAVAVSPAIGQTGTYDWTISASPDDPYVFTAPVPVDNIATYYLWYVCCNDDQVDGIQAAHFDIVASAPNLHLGTNVISPWLNAGGISDLLLAAGGCPTTGTRVADLLFLVLAPGTVDLGPSSSGGEIAGWDCASPPQTWPMDWHGLGIDALPHSNGGVGDCGLVDAFCTKIYCNPDGSCYEVMCPFPCAEVDCPPGVAVCSDCQATGIDQHLPSSTWGTVKALYR